MPPLQCPECRRFLKRSFVAALAERPEPCPGCGATLTPEHFAGLEAATPAQPPGGSEEPQATVPAAASNAGSSQLNVAPLPEGSVEQTPDGALDPTPDGAPDPTPDGAPDPTPDGALQPVPDGASDPQADPADDAEPHSVRPPDLEPAAVQHDRDVLRGWDVGVDDRELAGWEQDHRPFPTDTVLVGAAAGLSALLGGLLAGRRETGGAVRGALLGALAGVIAAAIARRVWRLEP